MKRVAWRWLYIYLLTPEWRGAGRNRWQPRYIFFHAISIFFPFSFFFLFLKSDALFFTSSMRIIRSSNISHSDRIGFKNKFGREEEKKKGFQEYTGELFIKRPEWNIEISARDDEFAFYGRVHLFVRVARVSLTIIVLRPFVRIANSTGHYNATRDRRCLTCR